MKSTLKFLAPLLVAFAVGVGCSGDDPSFNYPDNTVGPDGIVDPNSVGYLSLDGFGFTVEVDVETFTASAISETRADEESIDTDSFIVQIVRESDSEVVYSGAYSEVKLLTEPLSLSAGAYNLEVSSSEDIEDAGWDCPVYKGSDRYVIGDDNVTSASSVTCTLANVMVAVSMSADFVNLFNTDASLSDDDKLQVILEVNDSEKDDLTHSLTFYAEDSDKKGYFNVPSDETISVYIVGQYNTASEGEDPVYMKIEKGNWVETISGVKAGQFRNISVNVKIDNNAEGTVELKLEVATWAYDSEVDVDITSGSFFESFTEDVLTDTDEDDDTATNPDGETTTEGPEITWLGGYDFSTRYTIYTDAEVAAGAVNPEVALSITSETGITEMLLTIDSETLTEEELAGVGLPQEIDLIAAGDDYDPNDSNTLGYKLEALGLPFGDDVLGQTSLSIDISGFISLLAIVGPGETNFIISVTDDKGTIVRTIMLEKK